MFFVLFITALFIGISIYFYFRSEGLQRSLLNAKREFSSTQKENRSYVDSMALIAKRHEDFAKYRLEQIKVNQSEKEETLETITPLINNYSIIFRECLKGKGKLQPITKKCYDSYDKEGFKTLVAYISQQEKHIKRMWSSNNLSGYISLIEAFLLMAEQKKPSK